MSPLQGVRAVVAQHARAGGIGEGAQPFGIDAEDGAGHGVQDQAVAPLTLLQGLFHLAQFRDVAGTHHRAADAAVCLPVGGVGHAHVAPPGGGELEPGLVAHHLATETAVQLVLEQGLEHLPALQLPDRRVGDFARRTAVAPGVALVHHAITIVAAHQGNMVGGTGDDALVQAQGIQIALLVGEIGAGAEHPGDAALAVVQGGVVPVDEALRAVPRQDGVVMAQPRGLPRQQLLEQGRHGFARPLGQEVGDPVPPHHLRRLHPQEGADLGIEAEHPAVPVQRQEQGVGHGQDLLGEIPHCLLEVGLPSRAGMSGVRVERVVQATSWYRVAANLATAASGLIGIEILTAGGAIS